MDVKTSATFCLKIERKLDTKTQKSDSFNYNPQNPESCSIAIVSLNMLLYTFVCAVYKGR